ncbi:MAG: hypothetical protein DHS20C13_30650 [Thermodesulfobacteriota bacterium]|nr:MAG: hypothetical protein DHS20C13_30650 [Thermodesulfobacteriota bacterium]
MIFFIIKGYIFGKINRLNGLEKLRNMSDIDEGSLGYSVMKAMESDLFKEM